MNANGKETIAIALPGEHFSSVWVANWTTLFAAIFNAYNVQLHFAYSSNVYVTRGRILAGILDGDTMPDYVLWIDDDNTLTFPQFELLVNDLKDHQYLDAVAGWCWIQPDGYGINAVPSCGMFNGCKAVPLPLEHLVTVDGVEPIGPDLIPVEYTGFPVVLFKLATMKDVGPAPFAPMWAPDTELHFMGEDTSFCKRMLEAGLTLAVDRRVKVPHYKLRAAEPASVAATNAVLVG
jgi:hypothetical protein